MFVVFLSIYPCVRLLISQPANLILESKRNFLENELIVIVKRIAFCYFTILMGKSLIELMG